MGQMIQCYIFDSSDGTIDTVPSFNGTFGTSHLLLVLVVPAPQPPLTKPIGPKAVVDSSLVSDLNLSMASLYLFRGTRNISIAAFLASVNVPYQFPVASPSNASRMKVSGPVYTTSKPFFCSTCVMSVHLFLFSCSPHAARANAIPARMDNHT
ncbi:hypothetical protein LCGC14_0430300 [marine sediment metagenome]|uniref:Uncharacterized protein n=1 Tax=marine sediment metagenome TaxID=412755 RepID=A0A0F9SUM8_9ZZZZ